MPTTSTPLRSTLAGAHFAPRMGRIRGRTSDDSNAERGGVKKHLNILLDLMWPKSLNKEPVVVVLEATQLLGSFRDIMRQNFREMDVNKIHQWCACSGSVLRVLH